MDTMHKNVKGRMKKDHERQIRYQNTQTKVVEPNFNVGDFVLGVGHRKMGISYLTDGWGCARICR